MKRKQALAVILALAILLSNVGASAFASTESPVSREERKEEIMERYMEELHNTLTARPAGRSVTSSFDDVAEDTVAQLNALGYTAYNVNPQNVEEVEVALNTDLEQAGLPTDDSYIILIEGEDEEDTQGEISLHMNIKTSDEFNHTYNGKTYRMRWMTAYPNVTGGDATMTVETKNVVFYKRNELTALTVGDKLGQAISAVGKVAGSPQAVTLGSILSKFSSGVIKWIKADPKSSELTGMASSTWIRRYTQVFSNSAQTWISRCFVEEVNALLHVTSYFWNPEMMNNDTETKKLVGLIYSSKRDNTPWRKDAAAQAHEAGGAIKDEVPNVKYNYGGVVVCTHNRKLS